MSPVRNGQATECPTATSHDDASPIRVAQLSRIEKSMSRTMPVATKDRVTKFNDLSFRDVRAAFNSLEAESSKTVTNTSFSLLPRTRIALPTDVVRAHRWAKRSAAES